MVVFEDGTTVGMLGGGLEDRMIVQVQKCMGTPGWTWITPDEQNGILVETD